MDETKHTEALQQLGKAWKTAKHGRPYTEQQEKDIIQAALFFTGDRLPIEQAESFLRDMSEDEIEELFHHVIKNVSPELKVIVEAAGEVQAAILSASEPIRGIQEKLSERVAAFIAQDEEIQQTLQSLQESITQFLETHPRAALYAEISGDLWPYFEAELKKPKYNGATLEDIFDSAERDADGLPTETSLLMQAVKAARAAAGVDLERPALPAIIVRDIPELQYMMDKGNRNLWGPIWNTLASSPPGQQTFLFNMANSEDKRLKIDLPLMVSINFNELNGIQVTKKLTSFDKRVYTAVASLYNAKNENLPVQTIYKHMGYKGRAGTTDKEKIRNSLLKMMGALITIDNSAEASRYNYPLYRYHGALLQAEMIEKCEVNGGIADAVIHILKEPALMAFARGRDQIATVSLEMLQTPLSKTEENLSIEDYLIWRIKRAKHKKTHGSHKINYTKIFEATGIPTEPKTDADRKRKNRAPGKIKELLDYYRQIGEISRHNEQKDNVTIFW